MRTAEQVKANGVHYTPAKLARFLATRALEAVPTDGPLRILDPACGDGSLLQAVIDADPDPSRLSLIGMDTDPHAVDAANQRLAPFREKVQTVELHRADFLVTALSHFQPGLLTHRATIDLGQVSLAITNPPYVRTQVLGAARSQALAKAFGLSGRIDLYQAFTVALAGVLAPGGMLGLLCSNRFISTRTGEGLRRFLLEHYDLLELFDLGDTKLFNAAVLPAVLIGRRTSSQPPHAAPACRFTRVYEVRDEADAQSQAEHILDAVAGEVEGVVEAPEGIFRIERGRLHTENTSDPWRVASNTSASFLNRVATRTSTTFGDVLKIRVGIKTTADSVFIRDDWHDLAARERPEPALLQRVIMREDATRWATDGSSARTQVLYPYEMSSPRRQPIDLGDYPGARAYLESHRQRLEGRRYVIDAGRSWFEIWVPQQPSAWAQPKMVFPDISDVPQFGIDRSGSVVNGTCYWALLPDDDLLAAIMLGVANSTFGQQFYDLVCGNKLYAGRRRYMTQYVKNFPVPDPSDATTELAKLVNELAQGTDLTLDDIDSLESDVNALVSRAFGLPEDTFR